VVAIPVFVPHVRVNEATRVALVGFDWLGVDVSADEWAYGRYFAARWAQRTDFIQVEHDCIPWPGAIEAITLCSQPWCAYNYHLPFMYDQDLNLGGTVVMGCMKVTGEVMAATINCWDEPCEWGVCDKRLTDAARGAGFSVHQHFPGIVNANPALLRGAKHGE
jgi:hypothetical protein